MDVALRSQISCHYHSFDLNGAMLQQILSFSQLEKLAMYCWERDGVLALEMGFASLTHLKSLELTLMSGVCTFQQCSRCFRHLSQLTHLALGLSNRSMHDAQPITELTNLQSLALHPDMIAKTDGTLLFPCASNLTRLVVRTMHYQEHNGFPNGLIDVICAYASSLRSLDVRPPFADPFSNDELSLLPKLEKLEELALSGLCVRRNEFFEALQKMPSLTSLDIMPLDFSKSFTMKIFRLTQLKSLFIADMSPTETFPEVPVFHRLCHLTSLFVTGRQVRSFTGLASLLDLTIFHPRLDYDCNVSHTLRSAVSLTHLRLCGVGIIVPSGSLSHLTALKSLSLEGVQVDDQIFLTLSRMQLEDLRLHFSDDKVKLNPQVNLVTSLRRLTLLSGNASDDAPYRYLIKGCLTHLRYLTVDKHRLTREEADDLHRRLPCLRKIMTRFW